MRHPALVPGRNIRDSPNLARTRESGGQSRQNSIAMRTRMRQRRGPAPAEARYHRPNTASGRPRHLPRALPRRKKLASSRSSYTANFCVRYAACRISHDVRQLCSSSLRPSSCIASVASVWGARNLRTPRFFGARLRCRWTHPLPRMVPTSCPRVQWLSNYGISGSAEPSARGSEAA